MESPHQALQFMKKLANSPWAPIIRLIEDAEILGPQHNLDLIEDLEDCAVVVEEETDSAAPKKTAGDSSEDSDYVSRYYPSLSDSDSDVANGKIERCKSTSSNPSHTGRPPTLSCGSTSFVDSHRKPGLKSKNTSRSKTKACPKSKKPSSLVDQVGCENDSGNKTVVLNGQEDLSTKSVNYNGLLLRLKHLRIVLIDFLRVYEDYGALTHGSVENSVSEQRGTTRGPSESSDESGKELDGDQDPKPVVISDDETDVDVVSVDKTVDEWKKSCSSKVDNLKRPCDLSWGLDSIQELEKRRKLGKTTGIKVDKHDQEVELVTPCSSEVPGAPAKPVITSKPKLKPTSSDPLPDNTFGLNHWRMALVVQELQRLQELAEKLQKNRLTLEVQKSIAYKFKYSLNEVARLVTKKSLNRIVAEQGSLESEQRGQKCQTNVSNNEVKDSRLHPEDMSPSRDVQQGCQLDKRSNSTSVVATYNFNRPVVDAYAPLVQGVAAGFINVFDRLDTLESKFTQIENSVSKSKGPPSSMDFEKSG